MTVPSPLTEDQTAAAKADVLDALGRAIQHVDMPGKIGVSTIILTCYNDGSTSLGFGGQHSKAQTLGGLVEALLQFYGITQTIEAEQMISALSERASLRPGDLF